MFPYEFSNTNLQSKQNVLNKAFLPHEGSEGFKGPRMPRR